MVGLPWISDHLSTGAATYTTHNKHEINIYALSGIQAHNPSHQVASDLSLRWNGHQDWLVNMRNVKLLGYLLVCANLKFSLFKLYYTSTVGRIYTTNSTNDKWAS